MIVSLVAYQHQLLQITIKLPSVVDLAQTDCSDLDLDLLSAIHMLLNLKVSQFKR